MNTRSTSRLILSFLLLSLIGRTLLAAPPAVTIGGVLAKPRTFDLAEIRSLPQIEVEVDDHGKAAKFRGVRLGALLREAGAPSGEQLRGAQMAKYVLVTARDGYRAVYALPELDDAFTERPVILAYERDGKPLSDDEGPFRVIAAGEKRAARWVRQVAAVEVVEAPVAESGRDSGTTDVESLAEAWRTSYNAGDAAKVAALYSEDGYYLSAHVFARGRPAIQAYWERGIAAGGHVDFIKPTEVIRSGDLGYWVGTYQATNAGVTVDGRLLIVVRKLDGAWRIAAHETVVRDQP